MLEMEILKASIIHHITLVIGLIWSLETVGWCHPVLYFFALLYLFMINERYSSRLRRKLQFEGRKIAHQRRLLSDSESVHWLNHAVEKVWPICMEQMASQNFLLPIIPWFLDKYKPWTARKVVVQQLYLGRSPPIFTGIRVLGQTSDDDHLVLELGLNFLSADDMSAILAVQLRKRLGLGMWAKLHLTGMHLEGKILVGVKFIQQWPFLGRLRICFVEPPYFQMTAKPIFSHGVDFTEVPLIAGWIDKLLDIAFGQTLVEPNMLVIDLGKFASESAESWFEVDEKPPVAYLKLEILEAADMKPSDLNGLADPYVKGQLGLYKFKTQFQKKTLAPKWSEEFKIPITSWDVPNVLVLQVRDKDHIFDDMLGDCSVDINEQRDKMRHDMWLPLQNIEMGRLHIAVTVTEAEDMKVKEDKENLGEGDNDLLKSNPTTPKPADLAQDYSVEPGKMVNEYESVNIEGQEEDQTWVHHPGTEVPGTWESRKGHAQSSQPNLCPFDSPRSTASGSRKSDTNNDVENIDGNKVQRLNTLRRGLHRIGSIFNKSPNGSPKRCVDDPTPNPHSDIQNLSSKLKIIVDDSLSENNGNQDSYKQNDTPGKDEESPGKGHLKGMAKKIVDKAKIIVDNSFTGNNGDQGSYKQSNSPGKDGEQSPGKGHLKGMAKKIVNKAGRSAHHLKHALHKKGKAKLKDNQEADAVDPDSSEASESSNDVSTEAVGGSSIDKDSTIDSEKSLNLEEENGSENSNSREKEQEKGVIDDVAQVVSVDPSMSSLSS